MHSIHLAFDLMDIMETECTPSKSTERDRDRQRTRKACLAEHPVFVLGSYLYQNTEKFASYHVIF